MGKVTDGINVPHTHKYTAKDEYSELVLAVYGNRDGKLLIEKELDKPVFSTDPLEMARRAGIHDYFETVKKQLDFKANAEAHKQ